MTSDEPEQTEEELRAHFGPGGPVDVVFKWMAAALDHRDYVRCWSLSDHNFRLCRAQAWIYNNQDWTEISKRDRDELAARLATTPPIEDLIWKGFAETEIDQLHDVWKDYKPTSRVGAASRPRLIAPDLELVIIVPTDGEALLFEQPTLVRSLTFIVHHTDDGWKVASVLDQLPESGWPPTFWRDLEQS